jgi:hypothetical protein
MALRYIPVPSMQALDFGIRESVYTYESTRGHRTMTCDHERVTSRCNNSSYLDITRKIESTPNYNLLAF